MRNPQLARAALILLFVSALLIGFTATAFPRTFYDDFPFVSHWVDLLPPYNEHLVTDVGGLYLGFALLLGWAAWSLDPTLIRAVSCAWLLTATLHLVFHASHLERFETADAVAEVASLALLLVPPPLAIWGTRRAEAPRP